MNVKVLVAMLAAGAAFVVWAFATDPERNADEAARQACAEFYAGVAAIEEGAEDDSARARFERAHQIATRSSQPPHLESSLFVLRNVTNIVLEELENPDPGAIPFDGLSASEQSFVARLGEVDDRCRKAGVGPSGS